MFPGDGIYLLVQVLHVLQELGHSLSMLTLSDKHFPSLAHFLHSNFRSIQASDRGRKYDVIAVNVVS